MYHFRNYYIFCLLWFYFVQTQNLTSNNNTQPQRTRTRPSNIHIFENKDVRGLDAENFYQITSKNLWFVEFYCKV